MYGGHLSCEIIDLPSRGDKGVPHRSSSFFATWETRASHDLHAFNSFTRDLEPGCYAITRKSDLHPSKRLKSVDGTSTRNVPEKGSPTVGGFKQAAFAKHRHLDRHRHLPLHPTDLKWTIFFPPFRGIHTFLRQVRLALSSRIGLFTACRY